MKKNSNTYTREGAKGAEPPPLAKPKLRKKIKYRKILIFFCVSVIRSCVISAIYGIKNWLSHSKTSKSHVWRHFYDVIKVTSPKICNQNDVTNFFHFQAPPLAKSWLRSFLH